MIDAILTNTVLPQMSVALLERQMTGEQVGRIRVGVGADGFTYDFEVKAKSKKTSDQPKSKPAPTKKQPTGHAEAKTVPAEWGPSRRQVGEKPWPNSYASAPPPRLGWSERSTRATASRT